MGQLSLPDNTIVDAPIRILVMRYRFIGDTILTIPLLRACRHFYPNATIDVLVGPNSGELLTHCPYIDNLIEYDTTRKHAYENPEEGESTSGGGKKSYWSYAKRLRHYKYNMALVLKRSVSSATLAWLSWIPKRIGFDTEGRGFMLTQPFPYDKTKPEWDCFLDGLRQCGHSIPSDPAYHYLEAWPSEADEAKSKRLISDGLKDVPLPMEPLHLGIHITTSNDKKSLPITVWIRYAQQLLTRYPHAVLHSVGARQDADAYERLRQGLPENLQQRLFNHCGQTTLLESQALLAKCAAIAGVDSGTLHMAAAAGTPVVGVYLPELISKWAPVPLSNGVPHQCLSIMADQDGVDALVTAMDDTLMAVDEASV